MIRKYTQVSPVLFGVDAIEKIGDEAKALKATKALMIYDNGVKVTGMAKRITKLLEKAELEIEVFEDVLPDPTTDQMDALAQKIRKLGVDLIIGIGGGSSMDTAKVISILNANKGEVRKYFVPKGENYQNATPLILVPTSSGTGSEVTALGVVYDTKTKMKEAIMRPADISIVDPKLTITVPDHITATTGMDALGQAVEAYTSTNNDPRSDILALHAIKLIIENLEKAYHDGTDLTARTNMSLASNLAGIAFGDAMVHFGHAVSHELGSEFKVPHGVGVALALPIVVEVSIKQDLKRGIQLAQALDLEIPNQVDENKLALLAGDKIRKLMKNLGIKSLKDQEISREDALLRAEDVIKKNWFIMYSPVEIDVPLMEDLIAQMYDRY